MTRDADTEATDGGDSDAATNEGDELADLDPNAEEQARKVDRQLRRLQRETRE